MTCIQIKMQDTKKKLLVALDCHFVITCLKALYFVPITEKNVKIDYAV